MKHNSSSPIVNTDIVFLHLEDKFLASFPFPALQRMTADTSDGNCCHAITISLYCVVSKLNSLQLMPLFKHESRPFFKVQEFYSYYE